MLRQVPIPSRAEIPHVSDACLEFIQVVARIRELRQPAGGSCGDGSGDNGDDRDGVCDVEFKISWSELFPSRFAA